MTGASGMVLCSNIGDFFLVVGSPSDVDEIVGKSRNEAIAEFREYARGPHAQHLPRLREAGEIDWRQTTRHDFVV